MKNIKKFTPSMLNCAKNSTSQHSKKSAFTLAEMMVVLLITSVILACSAPVMTTKMKADQSVQTSPWKWVSTGHVGYPNDSYFGQGSAQVAHLGQIERSATDNAKFIINNTSFDDAILFKNGANALGHIRFQNNGLLFGSSANTLGQGSVGIGTGITTASNSVVVGSGANSENNGAILGNASTAKINGTTVGNNSTAGSDAIAIGNSTNAFDYSVAIGNGINNTVEYAVAIGNNSNVNDVGGIAIGNNAKAENSSITIGYNAESKNTSSIAIGAGAKATVDDNIAIGTDSKANKLGATAVGAYTLSNNTSGTYNTAIGMFALNYNTTGTSNTALGYKSSYRTTTGENNTSVGFLALDLNQSGSYNIAIGSQSSFNNISGENNTSVGYLALNINQSGSYNTAIGNGACAKVLGSNKTCIGYNSGPERSHAWASASDKEERIFIGSKSKFNDGPAVLEVHNVKSTNTYFNSSKKFHDTTVVINGNLIVKGGIVTSMPWTDDRNYDSKGGVNMIGRTGGQLEPLNIKGENSDEFGYYYSSEENGQFKTPDSKETHTWSDRRLKYVGKENNDGLAKLRQIKVFNYTFKKDPQKIPHVGIIAQDLQKIFPNAVKKGSDGFLAIRMEDMFYAVINAIKELDAKYKAQEKRIDDLEKEVKLLKEKIK